jgi:hypothetical protein
MLAVHEEKAAAGAAAVGTHEREHQGCAHQGVVVVAAVAAADVVVAACSAGAVGVAACTPAEADGVARSHRHHLGGAGVVAGAVAAVLDRDTEAAALLKAQVCAFVTRLPAPAAAGCCPWSAQGRSSPVKLT